MQTTPIFPVYQKYHAKTIDFHGWALPVQFSGIIREHLAVRQKVGLFDVSHMGELLIEGPDAPSFLDSILTNRISLVKPGFIKYSPMCYENGGTVDDLLVYRLDQTKFLLVVNASNTTKDKEWIQQNIRSFRVSIHDFSEATAQMALQGPQAFTLLQKIAADPIDLDLKYYQFRDKVMLSGIPVLLSRTGYTGEDGFEMYLSADSGIPLWENILDAGVFLGIQPIGLGARDTLRFEAGLPLYGNELGPDITPLEAGLKRFIDFEKTDFIGKEALFQQYIQMNFRHLVGLEMIERGIPRSGNRVFSRNQEIGYITSGNYSPSLEKNLALALLDSKINQLNQAVQVDIRGKRLTAKIIKFPFYTRSQNIESKSQS
jgi:aminomethyltransferase